MKLIRSINSPDLRADRGRRVLCIGAFDGLHLGHQAILEATQSIAAETDAVDAMLAFEPTPAEHFAALAPPARLTCFRERYERLQDLKLSELICPRFEHLSLMGHEEFVTGFLVAALGVSHVVVGHDFRYGAGRLGNVDSLRAAGEKLGFGVSVIEPVYLEDERISSTRIREALGLGDLATARCMLGRDYSMSGRVTHGLGLGRDIGFPTANVNLKRRRSSVEGIFAVQVDGLGPRPLDGVASLGSRPTVGGGKTLLEVFIFDFDSRIYGNYISVRFISRLRSEEKFPTIEAMQAQMHADVIAAKAALQRRIA